MVRQLRSSVAAWTIGLDLERGWVHSQLPVWMHLGAVDAEIDAEHLRERVRVAVTLEADQRVAVPEHTDDKRLAAPGTRSIAPPSHGESPNLATAP